MDFDGFDWDEGNWPKCAKHGVSREEIEAALRLPATQILVDARHSLSEERFLAVCPRSGSHHGLLVGFTKRARDGRLLVRPVTARYMHSKEVHRYGRGQDR
ncbi:MAG: BrnT family toxin [Devosia sp.]|nr:BrnT family toxin [Devosia sp.]